MPNSRAAEMLDDQNNPKRTTVTRFENWQKCRGGVGERKTGQQHAAIGGKLKEARPGNTIYQCLCNLCLHCLTTLQQCETHQVQREHAPTLVLMASMNICSVCTPAGPVWSWCAKCIISRIIASQMCWIRSLKKCCQACSVLAVLCKDFALHVVYTSNTACAEPTDCAWQA